MCPCADDNTEKVNGGNVTEQTDLSPVPTLMDCQSKPLEWGLAEQASLLPPTKLNIFRTILFIF